MSGQPFIPRQLNDYGLTLAEFRLVCHVARRGVSNEAILNIARICRMDFKTAKRCIKTTVRLNILHREYRQGRTLILKVHPISEWQPRPNGTLGVKRSDTPPKRPPHQQDQTTPHKGNPIEGNPLKGETPPTLSTVDRISFEQELKRICKELDRRGELKDYGKGTPTYNRMVELQTRQNELRKILGVAA